MMTTADKTAPWLATTDPAGATLAFGRPLTELRLTRDDLYALLVAVNCERTAAGDPLPVFATDEQEGDVP